jgi:hypothetical protein
MGSYYPPYWTILRSNTICLRKTNFFSIHENGLLRAYLRHCNINKRFSLQYFYTKYADFVPNVQDFTSKSRRKCKIPSRILPFGLSSWKFSFQSKTAKITSVTHTSRLIVHSDVFEVKIQFALAKTKISMYVNKCLLQAYLKHLQNSCIFIHVFMHIKDFVVKVQCTFAKTALRIIYFCEGKLYLTSKTSLWTINLDVCVTEVFLAVLLWNENFQEESPNGGFSRVFCIFYLILTWNPVHLVRNPHILCTNTARKIVCWYYNVSNMLKKFVLRRHIVFDLNMVQYGG